MLDQLPITPEMVGILAALVAAQVWTTRTLVLRADKSAEVRDKALTRSLDLLEAAMARFQEFEAAENDVHEKIVDTQERIVDRLDSIAKTLDDVIRKVSA